jgi:hypothetical protein
MALSLAQWPQDILRLVFARLDFYYIKYRVIPIGNKKLTQRLLQEQLLESLFSHDYGFPSHELLPFLPGLKTLVITEHFGFLPSYDPTWLLSLPPTLESIDFRFPSAQQIWLYSPPIERYYACKMSGYTYIRLGELCPNLKHLTLEGERDNVKGVGRLSYYNWTHVMIWGFIKALPRSLLTLNIGLLPSPVASEAAFYLPPHLETFHVLLPPVLTDLPPSLYSSLRNLSWPFDNEEVTSDQFASQVRRFSNLEFLRFEALSRAQLVSLPSTLKKVEVYYFDPEIGVPTESPAKNAQWTIRNLEYLKHPAWKTCGSVIKLRQHLVSDKFDPSTHQIPPNVEDVTIDLLSPIRNYDWLPRSVTRCKLDITTIPPDFRSLPPLIHLSLAGMAFPSCLHFLPSTLTSLSLDRLPSKYTEPQADPEIDGDSTTREERSAIQQYHFSTFCDILPPHLWKLKIQDTLSERDLQDLHRIRPSIDWILLYDLQVTGTGLPDTMTILSETTVMDHIRSMFSRVSFSAQGEVIRFNLEHLPSSLHHINITRADSGVVGLLYILNRLKPANLASISIQECTVTPVLNQVRKKDTGDIAYWPTLNKLHVACSNLISLIPSHSSPSITDLDITEIRAIRDNVPWKHFTSLTRLSISMVDARSPPHKFFSCIPKTVTWLRFYASKFQDGDVLELTEKLPTLIHLDAYPCNLTIWTLPKLLPNVRHLNGLRLTLEDRDDVSVLLLLLGGMETTSTRLDTLQLTRALHRGIKTVGKELSIFCNEHNRSVLDMISASHLETLFPVGLESLKLSFTTNDEDEPIAWRSIASNLPLSLTKLEVDAITEPHCDLSLLPRSLSYLAWNADSTALDCLPSLTSLKLGSRLLRKDPKEVMHLFEKLPSTLIHLDLPKIPLGATGEFEVLAQRCPRLTRLQCHELEGPQCWNLPSTVKYLHLRSVRSLSNVQLRSLPTTLSCLDLTSKPFEGYWGTDPETWLYLLKNS